MTLIRRKQQPDIGFKSYLYKGIPIINSETISQIEDEKIYFLNGSELRLIEQPSPKIRLWDEIKDRLSLAWTAIRHGRDAFD